MSRYFSQRELEHYFNVSEIYVFKKLFLLLFPWRQGTWTRQAMTGPNGPTGWYLPPRDDVNSPDLYIPAMAWPTYVLLCCFVAGLRGEFQDALMGYKALQIFLTMICELGLLKLAIYLFGVFDKSRMVELVAYSGYKMVGVCLTLVATLVTKQGKDSRTWLIWVVFIYTYLANSYFLVCCLPEHSRLYAAADRLIRCALFDMCSCPRILRTAVELCRRRAGSPGQPATRFSSVTLLGHSFCSPGF